MKKTMISLLLAPLLALCCTAASAGTIHFDDLPGDGTVAVANGYGGFDWNNVGVVSETAYPGSGYAAGTVSHGNTAFNWDGGVVTISKTGGTFDFIGAYFTSAWMDQELSFEGSRGGELLYSTAVSYVIDTLAPAWIELGWSGIDTLVIYNSSGTQWAMDEFTVPEPASLGLFGAALGGLLLAGRRRRAGGG